MPTDLPRIVIPPAEWFRGVEIVWVIWLVSLVLLCGVMVRALRRFRLRDVRKLLAAEDGAAYSLSYVLTFPVYMLIVCTVIESSLVLVTKLGTVYSAYAAARSAVVWLPAQPNVASQRINAAAVHAMTPFASSNADHLTRLGGGGSSSGVAGVIAAYNKYASPSPATDTYLSAKYRLASAATSVGWSPRSPVENQDVTLTVTYRMPLHIPGAARVLGHADGIYPIRSRALLQNEGPKRETGFNPSRPMGIEYSSVR